MNPLNIQQQRSIMSFAVIAIFAVAASVFLIGKGSDAANEIDFLNNGPLASRRAMIVKELDEKEGLGMSSTSEIMQDKIPLGEISK
ncbi:MAG: hypothetical protein HY007_04670 [Candidatus Sungbacteria bacterium]|nr:hypothetical protein [Candidatus Sungbacteria bacterium]